MMEKKRSSFECEFDHESSVRIPFFIRFFLIAVIFLIFDVEIAVLLVITFLYTYPLNYGKNNFSLNFIN